MKILVAIKRVVDPNVKVRVNTEQGSVDLSNVKMAMNPFCEIAVEEAVRLKEAGNVEEIVAVTIGSQKSQEQLRTAMALGVDRGILVVTETECEPLDVAKLLQAIVIQEQPDLIILGKQSIDSDNNQVGQMLSALCGFPQGTFAFNVSIQADKVIVGREVDGGEQTLELTLPAVITTDLRLNEPRYAKLPDIMKAKKKRVDVTSPEELGVSLKKHLQVIAVIEPPTRKTGIMVADAAELVDKLKNEAKVL